MIKTQGVDSNKGLLIFPKRRDESCVDLACDVIEKELSIDPDITRHSQSMKTVTVYFSTHINYVSTTT